jgi:hypothetical protein
VVTGHKRKAASAGHQRTVLNQGRVLRVFGSADFWNRSRHGWPVYWNEGRGACGPDRRPRAERLGEGERRIGRVQAKRWCSPPTCGMLPSFSLPVRALLRNNVGNHSFGKERTRHGSAAPVRRLRTPEPYRLYVVSGYAQKRKLAELRSIAIQLTDG